MADVLYTTTAAIRAALGVTEREIVDASMIDLDVAHMIEIELDKVYPTHAAAVAAGQAGGASPAEVKLYKTIKLFCTYQGAVCLLPQLQTLIAQKITDGETEMQRFMKDNLQQMQDRITGQRDSLRAELNPSGYGTLAVLSVPLVSAVPGYDPVTNEGAAP